MLRTTPCPVGIQTDDEEEGNPVAIACISQNMHTRTFFFCTSYQAFCFSCEPVLIGVIVRWHNNRASSATYSNKPSFIVSTFHKSATQTSHRHRIDKTFSKPSVCLHLMEHGRKQMWAPTDLWPRKQCRAADLKLQKATAACLVLLGVLERMSGAAGTCFF